MKNLGAVLMLLLWAAVAAGESPGGPVHIGRERQLFLDDFLIERAERVTRRVCPVRKHPDNPVIRRESDAEPIHYLVFGSVIYDEQEKLYKAWCDGNNGVYYLTSADGIHWDKPKLGLYAAFEGRATNRVALGGREMSLRQGEEVWRRYLRSTPKEQVVESGWRLAAELFGVTKDLRDPDPSRRYKMGFLYLETDYRGPNEARFHPGQRRGLGVAFSPDGIHWKLTPDQPVTYATCDGQTHWFFDEQTGRYVLFGRTKHIAPEVQARYGSDPIFRHHWGRAVARAESPDFIHWTPDEGQLVLSTDTRDAPTDEIYSMHVFPYEGIYIGLVQVFHNAPDRVDLDLQLAVSRDSVHFQRLSDRSPFIPVGGVGDWDRFNNSMANNPPIVVGDELRFYYSGRNWRHSTRYPQADNGRAWNFPYQGAVGFGTIKRDRFAALEATFEAGKLRTKPFLFPGRRLHVNAGVRFGALVIDLVDGAGRSVDQATIRGQDAVDIPVRLSKLESYSGRPIQLEFTIANGQLYSFWIE